MVSPSPFALAMFDLRRGRRGCSGLYARRGALQKRCSRRSRQARARMADAPGYLWPRWAGARPGEHFPEHGRGRASRRPSTTVLLARFAPDSNAFDTIRHTVTVGYKTDAEGGPVVTSLCGVSAPKGFAWTCYLDGKPCKAIGRVALGKETLIEWKTEKAEAK